MYCNCVVGCTIRITIFDIAIESVPYTQNYTILSHNVIAVTESLSKIHRLLKYPPKSWCMLSQDMIRHNDASVFCI